MRNRNRHFLLCIFLGLTPVLPAVAQATYTAVPQKSGSTTAGVTLQARLNPETAASFNSESALPDAPSAARDYVPAADPAPDGGSTKSAGGAPSAAGSGTFGIDKEVANRPYWAFNGAMYSTSIMNAELTMRCLEKTTCSYVPSSLRSRAALYGIGLPADIGISYLTYKLKQHNHRLWFVPPTLVSVANVYVGIHAYHRWQEKLPVQTVGP